MYCCMHRLKRIALPLGLVWFIFFFTIYDSVFGNAQCNALSSYKPCMTSYYFWFLFFCSLRNNLQNHYSKRYRMNRHHTGLFMSVIGTATLRVISSLLLQSKARQQWVLGTLWLLKQQWLITAVFYLGVPVQGFWYCAGWCIGIAYWHI